MSQQLGLDTGNVHVATHVVADLGGIHEVTKSHFMGALLATLTDVGAIPYSCHHPAHALELAIRPADGASGNAQLVRQDAMRRQLDTRPDDAAADRVLDTLGEPLVLEPRAFAQERSEN
ncbi:hypothetical protein D9M68_756830 [compost metagenome]